MHRTDPRRVLGAQLTGTAARCAQTRALTFREAVEAVEATLTAFGVKPGTDAAKEELTQAAVPFAAGDLDAAQWYYPDALRVLVRAGADAAEARRRRNARPRWSSGGG
jgi:hypothetical protein